MTAKTRVQNELLIGGGGGGVTVVRDFATVAELKAITNPTDRPRVGLLEAGREGEFIWKTGDYTSRIAADTYNGFYIKLDTIAATVGAYVRTFSNRANLKWWGLASDGTGDQRLRFQSAMDLAGSLFIPDGTYKCDNTLYMKDYAFLQFESRRSILKPNHNNAALRGFNYATERRFFITIQDGKIEGTGPAGTFVGADFDNVTYGTVRDTWINNCNVGARNGGTGQSSYYNTFDNVTISTVTAGYRNGTLGNDNKIIAGSVKDMVIGAEDDDNSGNVYMGVAVETFTGAAFRVSNSGAVADKIRIRDCRIENPSTSGIYASAVGIRFNSASQNCRARDNQIIVVATGYSDSGTANQESGN